MSPIIARKTDPRRRAELTMPDLREALGLDASATMELIPSATGEFVVVLTYLAPDASPVQAEAPAPAVTTAPPTRTRTRSATVATVAPPIETPAADDTL